VRSDSLESIGVGPCGEFGEYHMMVTNCPPFSSKRVVVTGERIPRADCWALDLSVDDVGGPSRTPAGL